MQLTSDAFDNGALIPSLYTCDGQNINPPLKISEIPQNTKSLALIVDDPDAPSGDWVHWLVWNIDPTTTVIDEDTVPANATQGTTDFGRTEYGGPCPHQGTHHYNFKLYALDTTLNLPISTRKRELEQTIEGHILVSAVLIGTYARQ